MGHSVRDDTCKQTLSVRSTYCDGPRVQNSGAVSVVFSCIERPHICTLVSTSFQTKKKKNCTKSLKRTRMHSSKMRTVRCSGRWVGGVSQHTIGRMGVCIPVCTGQGVYPSMHWAGGVCLVGCLPQCMLGYPPGQNF